MESERNVIRPPCNQTSTSSFSLAFGNADYGRGGSFSLAPPFFCFLRKSSVNVRTLWPVQALSRTVSQTGLFQL